MIRRLTFLTALVLAVGGTWTSSALGAGPADVLIGYWKLDGDTRDASGLENHGTAEGDAFFEAGILKQAMHFDGDGDYLVIDSVADDFTDNDLTLSAWIKTEDPGTWQWWFSCNTASGGNVIILGLVSGNIVVHQGDVQITSTAVVNDSAWHHVAYSRIDTVGTLYIDGVAEGTHTTTFVLSANDRWSIAQEWDSGTPGDFLEGTVDDVRIYDRGLAEEELPLIMTVDYGVASEPSPADGAIEVPREVALAWTPGDFVPATDGHTVYLSETLSDVSDGIGGVTLSDNTYTPEQRLDFGTTYYWRVDEVNGAPNYTIHEGDVWSFMTEQLAYPIASVTAATNGVYESGIELVNTINGAGLDANDTHSIDSSDMWSAVPPEGEELYVEYTFDRPYKLHAMEVWNYNVNLEQFVGFGFKDVTVEYTEDGSDWTVLDDVQFAQATGSVDYTANTTVEFEGRAIQGVRLTVHSCFGTMARYGLSEVRFLCIPVEATEPTPANASTEVSVETALQWKAGREAAAHEVYLGQDQEALSLVETVSTNTYETDDFQLETTYYWQIVEVNEVEAIASWTGEVWSFSTEEYIVLEDFEGYGVDSPGLIFQSWIDGWGFEEDDFFPNGNNGNGSGAQVGYLDAPFAEQTVVHGGAQSMPLIYDNSEVSYAEAERTLDESQNWSLHGIATLTVFFRGVADNTGSLYLKINNTKIPYTGDADAITKLSWQTWNVDLATVGASLTNVTKLAIGIDDAGAAGTLYVDDIRLYRTAPLAPVEPDNTHLLAYYAFDGDVTDGSGNGFDGQAGGEPPYVEGVSGQALEFDGGDDYVAIANDDRLNPGVGSFSITFWARLDPKVGANGTANWDLAIAKRGSSGSIGYYVGANRDVGDGDQAGYKFMLGNTGGSRVDTPYLTVLKDEWVFVASVLDRDQNVHRISVNGGSSWAEATPPSGTISLTADLGIGWDIGQNNYWFHGAIDEVRFYDTALSSEEVAWLANN